MVLSEIFILTNTCDQANTRFKQDHLTKKRERVEVRKQNLRCKEELRTPNKIFLSFSISQYFTANDYSPVRKGS